MYNEGIWCIIFIQEIYIYYINRCSCLYLCTFLHTYTHSISVSKNYYSKHLHASIIINIDEGVL